jgi:hypothetical protein
VDAALEAIEAGIPRYETELTELVPAVVPPRAARRHWAAWLAGAGLALALAALLWSAMAPRVAERGRATGRATVSAR